MRPDIAYAVGILSQFIKNLGQSHWEALKRVIMYLRTERGPHYRGGTIPFIRGRGRRTPSVSTHHANSLTYPATPMAPSVAMGSPLQHSTPESWTPMEVNRVIYHSRDSRDHETIGIELRRLVASRLVNDSQVLHPSLLNPWTPPQPRGRNRPPRSRGRRR